MIGTSVMKGLNQEVKHMNMDLESVKTICKRNINKIVIAYLNINSLRSKFNSLIEHVTRNVVILMIPESKLDSGFSTIQFLINDYSELFRTDKEWNNVLCKCVNPIKIFVKMSSTEGFYVEENLQKKKMDALLFLQPRQKKHLISFGKPD